MSEMRRVGAHYVISGDIVLHQAIVEIVDGRVVNFYEFDDELPMTEWLGDTIELRKNEEGMLQAWWVRDHIEDKLLE